MILRSRFKLFSFEFRHCVLYFSGGIAQLIRTSASANSLRKRFPLRLVMHLESVCAATGDTKLQPKHSSAGFFRSSALSAATAISRESLADEYLPIAAISRRAPRSFHLHKTIKFSAAERAAARKRQSFLCVAFIIFFNFFSVSRSFFNRFRMPMISI